MGNMKKRICHNPQKVVDIIYIKIVIFIIPTSNGHIPHRNYVRFGSGHKPHIIIISIIAMGIKLSTE